MEDQSVSMLVSALLAEVCWRLEWFARIVSRLSARERVAAFFVGIYERLCRRGLTNGSSFNLPLTQKQIADHLGLSLEHLNRSLRQMRQEHLMTFDRDQVVTIENISSLSDLIRGPAEPAHVRAPYFRADQD